MSRYERLIGELRSSVRSDEQELEQAYLSLGRRLCERKGAGLSAPAPAELAELAEAPAGEATRLREQIEGIRERAARVVDIEAQSREADRRIERAERRNEPLYETIGESAYRMYRQTPHPGPDLEEIFSELDSRYAELRNIEHGVEREAAVSKAGSFFSRVLKRGRLGLLRAKRAFVQRSLPALFRGAGRAVCQAGLKDYVGVDSSSSIAQAYWMNLEEQQELGRRKKRLEKQRTELMDELVELGATDDLQDRLTRLRVELEEKQEAAAEAHRVLGERAAKSAFKDLPDDPGVRTIIKRIGSLKKQRTGKLRHIRRLEAAVEMDRVEAEARKTQERMKQAEAEAQRHDEEARRLERKLADAEKRMEELKRAVGSRETLVEDTEEEK